MPHSAQGWRGRDVGGPACRERAEHREHHKHEKQHHIVGHPLDRIC
jgi:hypothetical protein